MLELGPTTGIQIINFVVLLFILKALLWKPLMEALDTRHKHIETQVKEAEAINAEARELKVNYEAQIAEAYAQAEKIVREALAQAEKMKEQILAEAREEGSRTLRQTEREVHAQREKAMGEVKHYLVDLTVATASRVLQESLDKATQEKIMAEFVRKVGEKYVN